MKIIEKSLDELRPYENNPRLNDSAVGPVAESIRQFGFKVPMVVTKDGTIVCGHTRYKAAQKLGLATVPCVIADDLTEEQIRAFRLADNKTSNFAYWDNVKLLEELDTLPPDIFTGFIESEIFEELGGEKKPLDKKDNGILKENEAGIYYRIVAKTPSKEMYKKIMKFLQSIGMCNDSKNDGEDE